MASFAKNMTETGMSPAVGNESQSAMNNSASTIYIPVWLTGAVSPAVYAEFEYYTVYVSLVCSVIGAVCSVQNLVVYDRQQRRNQRTGGKREVHVSFLMALCVGDVLFNLSSVITRTCSVFLPRTSKVAAHLGTILGMYAVAAFRRSAIWINALATLERFLTIAFPMGAASYVFKRAPVVVIVSVFLVVCSAHAYILFEYTAVDLGGGKWEQSVTQARLSDPALFESIKNLVRIVCFYTPLLASLVVNTLLMVALHRHARGMKGMLTSRGGKVQNPKASPSFVNKTKKINPADAKINISREAQAAKLILVLTLTFFFMALPSSINATVTSFTPDYGFARKEMFLFLVLVHNFEHIQVLTQVAITLASVIYSRRFRVVLIEMYCERCQKKQREMEPAETNTFSVPSIETTPNSCRTSKL